MVQLLTFRRAKRKNKNNGIVTVNSTMNYYFDQAFLSSVSFSRGPRGKTKTMAKTNIHTK